LTARQRDAGDEAELQGYLDLIDRARAAVPTLTTEALDRIHEALERTLGGERSTAKTLAEIERTLKPRS
jgi:hypothetical protein